MFIVAIIEDSFFIAASDLGKDKLTAAIDAVEAKYANNVVYNVGLCICLHEMKSVGDAVIHAGQGGAHVKARFSLVTFRPFIGEILTGTIASCSELGVVVTVGEFFGDVYIPPAKLPQPSEYLPEEHLWVWMYEGNQMFMDVGEPVRLRVLSVSFDKDASPMPRATPQQAAAFVDAALAAGEDAPPPMTILGTFADDGLGLLSWWVQSEAAPEDEAMADD